jgi:hypothetical protein
MRLAASHQTSPLLQVVCAYSVYGHVTRSPEHHTENTIAVRRALRNHEIISSIDVIGGIDAGQKFAVIKMSGDDQIQSGNNPWPSGEIGLRSRRVLLRFAIPFIDLMALGILGLQVRDKNALTDQR